MVYVPNVSTWRQAYNPLVGLNMLRLATLLTNAENGYYADLQWLYRFIEKRDATLKAVKSRRVSAIKKLDWDIKIKEGYEEDSKAKKQQEALKAAYELVDNLRESFAHMAMAQFRGFAHLEKHFNADGDITHLEPVPQWYWGRKYPSKDWLYNKDAVNSNAGQPIDPKMFIIREVDDPVDEPCAIAFLRKNMSQKDWDGFVETYGIPPLFVELPNGQGQITDEFQRIADKVIGDGRGVLPNGAKMATLDAGTRGASPFDKHIEYQDKQIVLAATSGLLTTLTQATGMNEGQSTQHADAFLDLAEADAMSISETFQKQFDAPFLMTMFESQEVMVYFELKYQEVDSAQDVIDDAVKLFTAGYQMDVEQLQEKTGYKLTMVQKPGMTDPNAAGYDASQDYGADQPVADAIANAIQATLRNGDDDLLEALGLLDKSIPEILHNATLRARAVELAG